MITDSYDLSEAIITPEYFFGEKQNICDIAIARDIKKGGNR